MIESQLRISAPPQVGSAPTRWGRLGDERLARLAGGGSEQAFAALYERHHDALYRYCRSIVRHDADAQDALQSTFASAFAALRRGQRDAPPRPWLFRIAHNESVSLLRRRRPVEELSERIGERSAHTVHERFEEREELAVLMADLHELPERQRGALVMRELSGLSHEEIAFALGTSIGAAKQTIFEARRALLEFAEGRTLACEDVRRTISDADGRVLRARRVRAHLRDCSGCAAFGAAIPARSIALHAIAPPLPALAAAGVLARVLGGTSGHAAAGTGGGGIAASAGAAATAGKSAGAVLAAKALVGVAIVATATVGATTALRHTASSTRGSAPAQVAPRTPSPSGNPAPGTQLSRAASARRVAGHAVRGAVSTNAATSAINDPSGAAGQASSTGAFGAGASAAAQGATGRPVSSSGQTHGASHASAKGRSPDRGGSNHAQHSTGAGPPGQTGKGTSPKTPSAAGASNAGSPGPGSVIHPALPPRRP